MGWHQLAIEPGTRHSLDLLAMDDLFPPSIRIPGRAQSTAYLPVLVRATRSRLPLPLRLLESEHPSDRRSDSTLYRGARLSGIAASAELAGVRRPHARERNEAAGFGRRRLLRAIVLLPLLRGRFLPSRGDSRPLYSFSLS